MLALLAKTAIVCIVPKVLDTVYDFFFVPEKLHNSPPKDDIIRKSALPSDYDSQTDSPDEKTIITPPSPNLGGNTIRKSEATDAARFTKAMEQEEFVLRPKIYHKKHDHSKITQEHFDFIVEAHRMHIAYNMRHPKNRNTVRDLTNHLNQIFGYDKGITSYSKVYLGKIDRASLPVTTSPIDIVVPFLNA